MMVSLLSYMTQARERGYGGIWVFWRKVEPILKEWWLEEIKKGCFSLGDLNWVVWHKIINKTLLKSKVNYIEGHTSIYKLR